MVFANQDLRRKRSASRSMGKCIGSSQLNAGFVISVPNAATSVSPGLRNAILLFATAVAIAKRQQIFYPGTSPDPNYSEPLPPGSFGCPFFGSNICEGTKKSGPGEFYRRTSLKLGKPRLFKYLFFGQPMVSVTGMKNIKQIMSTEFKSIFKRIFPIHNGLFID